jgi:hypothetical protein
MDLMFVKYASAVCARDLWRCHTSPVSQNQPGVYIDWIQFDSIHTHLDSFGDFALAVCPVNALAHFHHDDISATAVDKRTIIPITIRKEKR